MPTPRPRLLRFFLPLTLLLAVSAPSADRTPSVAGDLVFSSLDGSLEDLDGAADGVWTVPNSMVLEGRLACSEKNAERCVMRVEVRGDFEVRPGAGIEARHGLELRAAGDLVVREGAFLSTERGDLALSARGNLQIDGLVSAGSGGRNRGRSVSISLESTGGAGRGVHIGTAGTVISTGGAKGRNRIDIAGCGVEVLGLVASVGDGPGAAVAIDSCEGLTVDGRDLAGDVAGARRGRIAVSGSGGSAISLRAEERVFLDGSDLRVTGGGGDRISATSESSSVSWQDGRGALSAATEIPLAPGAIRISACEGVRLDGTAFSPESALEIVAACAGKPLPENDRPKPASGLVALPESFSGIGPEGDPTPAPPAACTPFLAVDGQTLSGFAEFVACVELTSENTRIIPRGRVTYKAGESIVLFNGFSVEGSSEFTAELDPTLNSPPEITSNGGGGTAGVSIPENTTAVTDVDATDSEGDTEGGGGLVYSLSGPDAALFTIDANGILEFIAAPDFETPMDAGADNMYDVTVTVTDSGALTDSQDITVTVTDVVDTGTIEIVKSTLPAGGTGFGFTDDIDSPNAFTLDDGQTKTFLTVVPGTYMVTEDDPTPGFDLTTLDCVDPDMSSSVDVGMRQATIDLDVGETVTCTFTNTQRGTIEIKKVTTPAGGTSFGFTDDIAAPNAFMLDDGQTQTFLNVVPGTYTVTEDDPTPGFDLTMLDCVDPDTGSSVDAGMRKATIDLDPGETVTCTFTNTQRGTIEIKKVTTPAGGTGFGFTDDIAAPNSFSLDDGQTETFLTVLPGTYTVTENDPTPGFDLTALDCVDPDMGSSGDVGMRKATIDLDPGETVTCTFTNTERGTIEIVKDSVPNGPTDFGFTDDIAAPNSFDLDDDSDVTLSNTQTFMNVVPGTYTVTEDDPTPGFDLTALDCVDPDSGSSGDVGMRKATIDLDPGETVTCTFTNTERGTIEIVKDSDPNGPTDFGFASPGLSPTSFDLDDDSDGTLSNTQTFMNVEPGTYTVTEDDPTPGFDLTMLSCVDPDTGSSTNLGAREATIDLDAGETVTCTFTNTQRGSVTIVKDTIPDDGQDFSFTTTGGLMPTMFDLDDDTDLALSNTQTFDDIMPGTYTVTEGDPSPATLTDISCDDGASATPSTDAGATATINVDPGEAVTCTFTNSFNTAPTGSPDSFEFVGNTLLLVDKTTSSLPEIIVSTTGGTTPAADGVLDNDTDPDMDPLSVSGIFASMVDCPDMTAPFTDCPTVNGGKVTMESNGQFSYTPKAGDTMATDMFGYKLFDGIDTDDVVVTLTRKNRVWYVKNDNMSGTDDGTSVDPFDTLAEAGSASIAGDTIFVFEGSGMTTGQDAGIELKTMQRLLGEGVALTVPDTVNGVPGPTLFAAGNNPAVEHATAMMDGVTVDATAADRVGIEIRGLTLSGTRNAIDVTSGGAFQVGITITDNLFDDSGEEAIDLNPDGSGDFDATVEDNTFSTSSPTGNAIDVITTASAGDVELSINRNTDVTSSSGTGINVDGSAGGNVFITGFADNTVNGATGGTGISILGATFDSDTSDADFDEVDAGTTAVGAMGSPVGGSGIILGNSAAAANRVSGNLLFDQLDVYATSGTVLGAAGSAQASGGDPPTAGFELNVTTGTLNSPVAGAAKGLELDLLRAATAFTDLQSNNSAAQGIDITSVTGTVMITSGSIAGSAGTAFDVGDTGNMTGGNANITYAGTINNTAGRAVLIQQRSGGTITLSGNITESGDGIRLANNTDGDNTITFSGTTKTVNTGTDTAVRLDNNESGGNEATINFTGGGLDIDVSSGIGLHATGGGVVNVTGSGNTIAVSAAGRAVVMDGMEIGASDVTFDSITSTGTGGGAPTSDVLSFTNNSNFGTFEGGTVDIDDTGGSARGIFIGAGTANYDFTSATIANTGGDAIGSSGAQGDVTFDTIDIDAPAGDGVEIASYAGGAPDNFTISGGTIDDPGSAGVRITGATSQVNVSSVTIDDTTAEGVLISGSSGTINVTNTTIGVLGGAGTTGGNALDIDGNAGTVTVNGSIVNTAGRAVEVTNRTGGFVNIGSSIDEDGTGISLATNGAGTINFSGGMALDTGANTAFSATGGGTVNVTGTNTIGASGAISGTGVNIVSTSIGSSDVTFQSIDVSGATNGIVLNNTGSSGGLTVTGIDGPCGNTGMAKDCDGGIIQNTTGESVSLTNTRDVSLSNMRITGSGINGIRGSSVTNLTVDNCDVTNNGNAVNEGGIRIESNLLGTSTISDSLISGSAEHNIEIIQTGTNVLTALNITNSDISDNSAGLGADGLLVETRNGSSATVTVSGSRFDDNQSDAIQVSAIDSSSASITVTETVFVTSTDGSAAGSVGARGMTLSNASTADITFDINGTVGGGNSFTNFSPNIGEEAINITVLSTSTGTAVMNGKVRGNTFTNSGGAVGLDIRGDGLARLLIDGNTANTSRQAIDMIAGDLVGDAADVDLTITNNNVTVSGTAASPNNEGIAYLGDRDTNTCLNVRGNTAVASGTREDIALEDFSTVMPRIESSATECGGGPCADEEAHLLAANTITDAFTDPHTLVAPGTCVTPP